MKRLLAIVIFLAVLARSAPSEAQVVPGSPGSPSNQVLTVQGCSGCTALGSITTLQPYNSAFGQPIVVNGTVGIAGFNGVTQDAIFTSPSGTTIGLGQAGIIAVTGTGPSGTVPVELPNPVNVGGSVGVLSQDGSSYLNIHCQTGCGGGSTTFPYSGTSSGQTATTASFLGAAGIYNSSAPTLTNTQAAPIQLDVSGNTKVNVAAGTVAATQSGTWNIGSITTLPAIPTGANTIGAVTQASGPWTNNVTQFGGTNVSTGTGASGAGIPRVTVSNDSTVIAQAQTYSTTVTIAPVITSSVSYGAGNCIGTQGSAGGVGLLTLTSAFRSTQDSGVLESIAITMNETQTTALDVFVLSSAPGTSICNDKGAPAIVVGDSAKVLGEYTLSAPVTALGANNTTWNLDGIGKQITSSSTSIYLYVVAVSAVTTAASATMSLSVGILQD